MRCVLIKLTKTIVFLSNLPQEYPNGKRAPTSHRCESSCRQLDASRIGLALMLGPLHPRRPSASQWRATRTQSRWAEARPAGAVIDISGRALRGHAGELAGRSHRTSRVDLPLRKLPRRRCGPHGQSPSFLPARAEPPIRSSSPLHTETRPSSSHPRSKLSDREHDVLRYSPAAPPTGRSPQSCIQKNLSSEP